MAVLLLCSSAGLGATSLPVLARLRRQGDCLPLPQSREDKLGLRLDVLLDRLASRPVPALERPSVGQHNDVVGYQVRRVWFKYPAGDSFAHNLLEDAIGAEL